MVTIVIDQLLSECAMFKHICIENNKKLYTSAGKYDDQLQFKAIIKVSIVSNLERFIDNSAMSPGSPTIVNIAVQENHSVYLSKFWMAKRKMMSDG